MPVKVNLFHPALQEYINYPKEVTVRGTTVGECLNDFIRQYPGAEKWLLDEKGRLLEPVFVFLNFESGHKAELTAPVRESDEMIIVMALIGG